MKVLFASKPGIASFLIRKFTWSRFSHVAIVMDGYVIQSTFLKGVHTVTLEEFYSEYPRIEEVNIKLPNELAAKVWLQEQIGKPYDFGFILGFVFRKDNWEKSSAWVCNELMEFACVVGGKRRIRGNISRVSPQISYMISVDEDDSNHVDVNSKE